MAPATLTYLYPALELLAIYRLHIAAGTLFLYIFSVVVYRQFVDPLHDIPGPFWARYTRLWKLLQYRRGKYERLNIALHEKYGPIVRVAPNEYSLKSADACKVLYGSRSKFIKSNWYKASALGPNLFTEQDEAVHGFLRRKVANAYSLTALLEQEQYVDSTLAVFLERLKEHASNNAPMDLGHWFQCYAFDVIGEITVAQRFGFLDRGEDVDNIMASLESYLTYASLVGVYWQFHGIGHRIESLINGKVGGMATFAIRQINATLASEKQDVNRKDFLSRLYAMHKENPTRVTTQDIFSTCLTNIGAGSDTTSISLNAIFYYLMKNPKTMKALQQEIDTFATEGRLSDPVTFQEASKMPYLQAVIKEAMRLHPATGFPLERITPAEGATVAGRFFPAGTVVGVNAWVSHYDKAIYGPHADQFIPERWLVSDAECRALERSYMPFGMGARTCVGKNISLLEMSKAVPQILRQFNFEFADPKAEWKTFNQWFVKQKEFIVYISNRN